jgi:hypothetical protein
MLYTDQQFSRNFCKDLIAQCLGLLPNSRAINLVAVPGTGVTFFVRHLANLSPAEFISINSYEMHEFTKAALYNQLARKLGLEATTADQLDLQAIGEALKKRAGNGQVVLVFNRFDRLGPILDQALYENLHFLSDVTDNRLIMLFVTAVPFIELAGTGLQGLLRLIDQEIFFAGYSISDLNEIMATSGNASIEPAALKLSGGHHALLQILMRCQNLDNALADPMVELLIKDMYIGLSPKRRKMLEAVAAGRRKQIDPYLISVGYIRLDKDKRSVFTSLLAEYALRQNQAHLPVRERRLWHVLKRNVGRVVSKQEIFDAVWRDSDGIATDWALNALVYRLRRHPSFDSQRYTVESHKKQGYILRDHQS